MARRNIVGALAPLLLIAACSGGGGNSSSDNPSSSAADPASTASSTNPVDDNQVTASPETLTAGTNPDLVKDIEIAEKAGGGKAASTGPRRNIRNPPAAQTTTERNAFRLLQQTTFGGTEAGIAEVVKKGPKLWLAEQFAMPVSTFGYANNDLIHKTTAKDFCNEQFAAGTPARDNCWRDWFSSDPLKLDFFYQASVGTDQLRQRVGFALSQILVVSDVEVHGTYGLSDYYQMLRDQAFGNYRDILKRVTLHPLMGEYLNMVNNDSSDPNENYARELLQLFSVGTCELNPDASLKGSTCIPTYDNNKVRDYAYALTGWTYPKGGIDPWCDRATNPWCGWTNPKYIKGTMEAVAAKHDSQPRALLSGISLAAGHTPEAALEAVLDSVMNHPNTAPFMSLRLIQSLVKSNPSSGYVQRVASAFTSGKFDTFGEGKRGDLKATIAAIVLDAEARDDNSANTATAGMLRDPVIRMINSVRALNGFTDGERMGKYGWGTALSQPVFNSPSVFNFYSPEYRLPGNASIYAPQFQLASANTNLAWPNFANDLIYWWYNKGEGLSAKTDMLGTKGTKLNYAVFESGAADPDALVARLDRLLTGGTLSPAARTAVVTALKEYTDKDTWLTQPDNSSTWQRERFRTAAYLLLSSPHFQIQK